MEDCLVGKYSLSIICNEKNVLKAWVFTTVYGPVQQELKLAFLEELDTLGRAWNLPWIIVGDYNAVRTRAEHCSGRATKFERE